MQATFNRYYSMETVRKIKIIDSHTAGEPTRVVVDGFPALNGTSTAEKLDNFRLEHDSLRSGIVREPRGHEAVVGALLLEPSDKDSAAGVIFFNNVGYLGMCGHGTIGVIKTLEHLGKIVPGEHILETPVGNITALLDEDGSVAFKNVASRRSQKDIPVETANYGVVYGDIAYGGNWFFLINKVPYSIDINNLRELTAFGLEVKQKMIEQGITAENGAEIDHIEMFESSNTADSRNFVLCPGGEYDRSPCGTGTSAKIACLYADGKLREGEIWKQESIIGSSFEASFEVLGGEVIPTIKGNAYITAESVLIFDERDPFRFGFV